MRSLSQALMGLSTADQALKTDRTALLVARVIALIFVPAGLVKFVAYGWELDAFERFGLPAASIWVFAAGLIEVGGAASLLTARGVLISAPLLAVTMAVAIGVSGVAQGDVIPSLTLAPALLGGLLFLMWRLSFAKQSP